MTREIDYRRAFKIACELLNGSVLYGIDADKIYEIMAAKEGVVSSDSYESYILNNLQELDRGQYASEPTTKNNLGVDKEQLKTMIRGLTKWYVKRDNTEVGEPNTAVGLLYDDVMFGIDRLPSVTPQEPKPMVEIDLYSVIKQKYIEREVLDKIRAEIKQYQSDYDVHGTEYDRTAWKAFNRCLQIIDKYKAESEDKE